MKKYSKILFLFVILNLFFSSSYAEEFKDSIKIATYNLLNYPGSDWQTTFG